MTTSEVVTTVKRIAVMVVLAVVAYCYISASVPVNMEWAKPDHGSVTQPAVSDAERLVKEHHCWTGEAPADVKPGTIPGGVVMSLSGKVARYYSNDALVGKALEHLFTRPDPQVVAIYGFCR